MKDDTEARGELIAELAQLRKRLSALGQPDTSENIADARIAAINECFLEFGLDPNENIQRLTSLCGRLMEADCALYNRLEGGLLFSAGQWQTPPGYNPWDKPEGHICYDVMKKGADEVVYVPNLPETPYYKTDPNVARYELKTYIAHAVRCGRDYVGSLCMVFQKDYIPAEVDKRLMGIVASAIGVEEERRQAEEALAIRVERLKRLSELSMTLTGDPMDVFKKIARIISELLEVRVVCLSEVRGETLCFLAVYAGGEIMTDSGQCPIEITPCSSVKDARDLRVYDRVAERFPEATFLKEHNAFYYCGFPAFDGAGEVVAITCLLDDKPHEFSEEDKDLMKIFGQRIGTEFERRKMLSDKTRAVEENERLQAQLIQAQKMEAVGTLAGGIAHDFNNIMIVIKNLTSLALSKSAVDDTLKSYLEPIREVSERGINLVQQLLIFSQNKPVEFSYFNVNDVIDDFMKIISNIISEDISINKKLEHGLWDIKADKGRIEQVITNLVINSRDSMLMGGVITLLTENVTLTADQAATIHGAQPGNFICLTVQDTGKGMDKETIKHIFEPFFTTKAPRGTGLGLSVVYGIVKELSGWINVASLPGHGSKFMVYLPISTGSGKAEAHEHVRRKPLDGGNRRILLVEDDKWVRKSTAMVLSENGYVVFEASSAEQAIGLFYKEKGRFDLVMSDVVMPGKSGLQLVGPLLDINPSISMLLCSGHLDDKAQLEQIIKRGISYIQKPYEIEELLCAIEEIIEEDSKKISGEEYAGPLP